MADEPTQTPVTTEVSVQTSTKPSMSFADLTVAAVGFEKIVIGGLLACVILILCFSFRAMLLNNANADVVTFVLAFFKDIALIMVGALANSVQHKKTN